MARAATKLTKKPRIKKPATIRRSKSVTLEEKNIGRETVNWDSVLDQESAMRETLNHYRYFYDMADYYRWGKEWVKTNRTKTDYKYYTAAEDWRASTTVCCLCKMMTNGAKFDEKRMTWVNKNIDEVIEIGKKAIKAKKEAPAPKPRKTPAEVLKERTNNFIGEVEGILDNWTEHEEYSVYDELKKADAAYNTAKELHDYYLPLSQEIVELTTKKTDDLVEAYSKVLGGIRNQKKYLAFVNKLISDAAMYMTSKKAVRKPRVKKAASAEQQIVKVQYLKESAEYKVASIDPIGLIGATIAVLFNAEKREVTILNSATSDGFTVKGTTIQNIDLATSTKKKIRKPEIFLGEVTKTTKARMVKVYESLTTKPSVANGRLNQHTIILKAYK